VKFVIYIVRVKTVRYFRKFDNVVISVGNV